MIKHIIILIFKRGGKMKIRYFLIIILIFLRVGQSQDSLLANIEDIVHTEFGIYQPYQVDFEPNAPQYEVESDFSNVANYEDFKFTEAEEEKLLQNNFVVVNGRDDGGTSYMEIYDIYNEARENSVPQFITSDAALHTFHKLYDKFLREAEQDHFIQYLVTMDSILYQQALQKYETVENQFQKNCFKNVVAYFSVPLALLKDDFEIPAFVADTVSQELELIKAHQGYLDSPLFGAYSEDYSQYKPRGHYTKTDSLEKYFKAMMWHGRQTFVLRNKLGGDLRTDLTGAALTIIHLMENLQENHQLWNYWNDIYIPTVFFVGQADDILPQDYLIFAEEEYFQTDFSQLSFDQFLNDSVIADFIKTAEDYFPEPKITTQTPKGMRFMGQRFIPDSYILDQLVYANVESRAMPKSLDVLAALHTKEAYNLLEEMDETEYPNYIEQLAKLKQLYKSYPAAKWAENLYWNWLYCLMPLLTEKGAGYPPFMQNLGWLRKDINTALGSWGELRHDTILYAKQSETEVGTPPYNEFIKGYVEPNPHLFARLASLAKFMREGLLDFELLGEFNSEKLLAFEELMVDLKDIAVKELTGGNITTDEYKTICLFGKNIGCMISDARYYSANYFSEETMPVIADVHTDPNSNLCLEEGIGYPNRIFVICKIEDQLKIAVGGVFSYFEFIQPISSRLTDEEWRLILLSEQRPEYPFWTDEFAVIDTTLVNDSPNHYPVSKEGLSEIDNDNNLPKDFALFQNYPNPFNPETTISFDLPQEAFVKITVYNVVGQKIREIFQGDLQAGTHQVNFNARGLESGVYFYKLESSNFSSVKKCLLIK